MTLRASVLSPNPSIASVSARQSGVSALGEIDVGSAAFSSSTLRVKVGLMRTSLPKVPTRARSPDSRR
jgi:hypothetical protein